MNPDEITEEVSEEVAESSERMGSGLLQSSEQLTEKIMGWWDTFIDYLPNLVVALVAFIVAYMFSRWVGRQVQKRLRKRVQEESLRSLISTTASLTTLALGLFLALSVLHLDTVLTSLLAGAGVAGLAVGLALQSSLSNTFAGIYLAVKRIMNVGDWVETNGYQGFIQEVTLRYTLLQEADNNLVVIPNQKIIDNPFKNYGLTEQVRVVLKCGVAYGSDLEEVEEVAKQAIRERYPSDESKDIEFYYMEFGSSSIDFQLRFWVDARSRLNILASRSEAIKVLKAAFDEHGIVIPFPIRTLDFPEGGVSLRQVSSDSAEA